MAKKATCSVRLRAALERLIDEELQRGTSAIALTRAVSKELERGVIAATAERGLYWTTRGPRATRIAPHVWVSFRARR